MVIRREYTDYTEYEEDTAACEVLRLSFVGKHICQYPAKSKGAPKESWVIEIEVDGEAPCCQ